MENGKLMEYVHLGQWFAFYDYYSIHGALGIARKWTVYR